MSRVGVSAGMDHNVDGEFVQMFINDILNDLVNREDSGPDDIGDALWHRCVPVGRLGEAFSPLARAMQQHATRAGPSALNVTELEVSGSVASSAQVDGVSAGSQGSVPSHTCPEHIAPLEKNWWPCWFIRLFTVTRTWSETSIVP